VAKKKKSPPPRYTPLPLADLKQQAQREAVTLGPDHPKVKLLRKTIADREGGR
jgi:hypothetical protein